MKLDHEDPRELPEYYQLEIETARRRKAMREIAIAIACMAVSVSLALIVAAQLMAPAEIKSPPVLSGEELDELVRIERDCNAARTTKQHDHSCHFSTVEDARAWQRIEAEAGQ